MGKSVFGRWKTKGWVGSRTGSQIKRGSPWEVGTIYKFAMESTHELRNSKKNVNKFQKNLKFWEKEFCSKTSFENDKLELLGPR